jgi:metal-responsive CopG/Arc/MetJ family transcriptional regulator
MPSNIRPVGRKRINEEEMPARFPAGTLARLDALLNEKEKRSDFIREAVEREIKRRETAEKRKT